MRHLVKGTIVAALLALPALALAQESQAEPVDTLEVLSYIKKPKPVVIVAKSLPNI